MTSKIVSVEYHSGSMMIAHWELRFSCGHTVTQMARGEWQPSLGDRVWCNECTRKKRVWELYR